MPEATYSDITSTSDQWQAMRSALREVNKAMQKEKSKSPKLGFGREKPVPFSLIFPGGEHVNA
jgi:hypothetical protein